MTHSLNIENLQYVRSLIAAAPPEHASMARWGGYCGTACCIGGWAEVGYRLQRAPEKKHLSCSDTENHALAAWLGMPCGQFDKIVSMCSISGENWSMVGFDRQNGPKVRKAVLLTIFDQLIETGGWDWEAALAAHGATAIWPEDVD